MIPAQPISCISRMLPLGCSDPQVFFCEVDSTPACPSPHSAHLINSATPPPAPATGLAAARAQSGQVVTRTTANRASGSPLPPAPELNVTGPLGNPPEGHPDKSQIKSTELQRGDRQAGISPPPGANKQCPLLRCRCTGSDFRPAQFNATPGAWGRPSPPPEPQAQAWHPRSLAELPCGRHRTSCPRPAPTPASQVLGGQGWGKVPVGTGR